MILLDFCKNKRVGVIGLGKTGKAVVDVLLKSGALVGVYDDVGIDDFKYKGLDLTLLYSPEGNLFSDDWKKLDVMVVSPGISMLWPRAHPAVQFAHKHNILVTNDVDLFQRQVSGRTTICVSGTNGKSTTTALIGHVFASAERKSVLGGNFGLPVLLTPADRDFYIFELSSYQLESCRRLGFDTAILLNITPDHIVRHGGMHGYVEAKQKIFANFREKSQAIIGVDDDYGPVIEALLVRLGHPNIIPISGARVPDAGIGWQENNLIDNRYGSYDFVCKSVETLDGDHNRQNIAASYAACVVNGIEKQEFCDAVVSFDGLPHRQELIATINGVKYINDSKATNVQSTKQALRRFSNLILILGGRPKDDGVEKLADYFSKIKYAFLIGEAADDWYKIMRARRVKCEISNSLDIAVNNAYKMSKLLDADIVLLSPACASFDQFKDFEDRGNEFRRCVKRIERKTYSSHNGHKNTRDY
ncbi:MAG: UDP-N-acetylmuramoyl-L-alanine--D-glutamate ligase [Holosporaceae bacterium]|jgi:UDP-N-acetylmuramoylalanine--D-glutamate ligase|nr:UDP-N-acetylmuramoyl-L-alanine--D-glutamate ligase [Holosporaceae bacterium]